MSAKFDLKDKLKQLSKKSKEARKRLHDGVCQNARDACEVMVEAAREHTPHDGDGKRRGFNVITNSLQEAWHAKFEVSDSGTELGYVHLTNTKDYAGFVQKGHRVPRHFVPWLYKDDLGTLSYETDHAQPMFGLVVGTKTPYVEGVDMVGPAIEAFDKSFKESNELLLDDILNGVFDKK